MVGSTATEMFSGTGHSTFTNPGLAVANAAGVSGGTPPGSLFSIYGTGLATSTAQPQTAPYPITLGGASVTVNGESAPLSYASPTQINAQMPLDITRRRSHGRGKGRHGNQQCRRGNGSGNGRPGYFHIRSRTGPSRRTILPTSRILRRRRRPRAAW